MSRASVLARGRTAAEAGMVDACTVTRGTVTATNPETGAQTVTTATVYTGRCRVQQRSTSGARDADPGQAHLVMLALELHLPIAGSGEVREGDLVTITACVHDPSMVGRTMRVRELAHKSEATARRLGLQEAT